MTYCKLSDHISIKHGYAFDGEFFTDEDNGVVLVTPGNFAIGGGYQEGKGKYFTGEYSEEFVLQPDDLIVTMTDLSKRIDTLGYGALVPDDGRVYLHNQRIGLVQFNDDEVDKHYLSFLMRSYDYQRAIAGSSSGSTVHHSSPDKICSYEFDLPSLDAQHRIASILMAYDNLIENNRRQIALLEEAAQRLYKEWFVDLRFPGFKNVTLIEGIPERWEIVKVGSILKKIPKREKVMRSDYLSSGSFPVVDQGREYVAGYTGKKDCVYDVDLPLIVFGDHTCVLKLVPFPFAVGADGTQLLRSNSERLSQLQLYCALKHIGLETVSYQRHFKILKEKEILLPTNEIAKIFDDACAPLFDAVSSIRNANTLLAEARDRLLPRLMSGEIEVEG